MTETQEQVQVYRDQRHPANLVMFPVFPQWAGLEWPQLDRLLAERQEAEDLINATRTELRRLDRGIAAAQDKDLDAIAKAGAASKGDNKHERAAIEARDTAARKLEGFARRAKAVEGRIAELISAKRDEWLEEVRSNQNTSVARLAELGDALQAEHQRLGVLRTLGSWLENPSVRVKMTAQPSDRIPTGVIAPNNEEHYISVGELVARMLEQAEAPR